MNAKKITAVLLIWLMATLAWMYLGYKVTSRTGKAQQQLSEKVANLWGEAQVQNEPTVTVAGEGTNSGAVALAKSQIEVTIKTEPRSVGLLWFSIYYVTFTGNYTITNETSANQSYSVRFSLPDSTAEFANQKVSVDGNALAEWTTLATTPPVAPGESAVVTFSYQSTGTEYWKYDLPPGEMIRDLTLTLKINSPGYDFEAEGSDSGPPVVRNMMPDAEGYYALVWKKQLVSNTRDIMVKMPQRQQPGPLVKRICWFAPVCLFFFFVVLVTIQIVKHLPLHPMHYLFLSAAFFAFHLLMAYLVDHWGLHRSFWTSAAASVFLVVMYLWMAAGAKTAILYAGLSQLVYLVLFSYAFFIKGFTGLAITIASVVTLAVLMVLTAKVKWGETLPELEAKPKQSRVPIQAVESVRQQPEATAPPGFVGENNGNAKPPPAQ